MDEPSHRDHGWKVCTSVLQKYTPRYTSGKRTLPSQAYGVHNFPQFDAYIQNGKAAVTPPVFIEKKDTGAPQ